jgi:hypothetical protein
MWQALICLWVVWCFNTIFNYVSVILWQSALLVVKSLGMLHVIDNFCHIMLYRVKRHEQLTTYVLMRTNCIGSSNYHTTMMATWLPFFILQDDVTNVDYLCFHCRVMWQMLITFVFIAGWYDQHCLPLFLLQDDVANIDYMCFVDYHIKRSKQRQFQDLSTKWLLQVSPWTN